MARKKLYKIGYYYGGPYERGTHCVSVVDIGMFLADTVEEAEAMALESTGGALLGEGDKLNVRMIRRSKRTMKEIREMYRERSVTIKKLTRDCDTMQAWMDQD